MDMNEWKDDLEALLKKPNINQWTISSVEAKKWQFGNLLPIQNGDFGDSLAFSLKQTLLLSNETQYQCMKKKKLKFSGKH